MRVKSWHTFDERLKLSVLGNGAGIGCGKVQQSNPRWGRLLGSLARRSSCRKKRIFFKEVFRNVGKKTLADQLGNAKRGSQTLFFFVGSVGRALRFFSIQLMLLMSDVARKIRPSNFVELLLANAQLHSIQFAYLLLLPRLHILYCIYLPAGCCVPCLCLYRLGCEPR